MMLRPLNENIYLLKYISIMAKKLHIILPGGGVNGCFQAGFLYELHTKYKHMYEIYQLDCTSVGALNGLALITEKIDKLKEIWLSIKCLSDIFPPMTSVPILVNTRAFLNSFYAKGLYSNEALRKKVYSYDINDTPKEVMKKFNCVVTDIKKGEGVYINGLTSNIREYVLASASPWIITPPQAIDSKLYTDGGLLDNFPIKMIDESKADLKIILGYDDSYEDISTEAGENIFTHLQNMIDIGRKTHYKNVTEKILNSDLIVIPLEDKVDFIEFNENIIKKGFEQGQIAAKKFVDTHLITSIEMVEIVDHKN